MYQLNVYLNLVSVTGLSKLYLRVLLKIQTESVFKSTDHVPVGDAYIGGTLFL